MTLPNPPHNFLRSFPKPKTKDHGISSILLAIFAIISGQDILIIPFYWCKTMKIIQCGKGTVFSSNKVVNIFITIQRNTGICWNAVQSENVAWKSLWVMLIALFIFLINLLQFLWLYIFLRCLQKEMTCELYES